MAMDTPSAGEGSGAVPEPEVQGEVMDGFATYRLHYELEAARVRIFKYPALTNVQVPAVYDLDDQADGFK